MKKKIVLWHKHYKCYYAGDFSSEGGDSYSGDLEDAVEFDSSEHAEKIKNKLSRPKYLAVMIIK